MAVRDVVIVGAGFSGLCMGIELGKVGITDWVIFDEGDEIGGTWRDNTYPGCACDVPSHLYSFSFAPNPDWSRTYSGQAEILAYMKRVVDQFGLGDRIELGVRVVGAAFDDAAGVWRVTISRGGERSEVVARALVMGTGALSSPNVPKIRGIEDFEGPAFHSARWRHDVDLTGKRVAVVGTGASAVQFVPHVAKQAEQVHVFQRTAPWVLPKDDRAFADSERARFARAPWLRELYRKRLYWAHELKALAFVGEPRLLEWAQKMGHEHIADQIEDEELRRKVTPNFRMGCKRILFSNTYYPALERANVEVITSGAVAADARALRAADGTAREVDVVVFGTGFKLSDYLTPLDIVGSGDQRLNHVWRESGAEGYFGVAVSGFPNMYLLVGPNSALGHNSMIFMIESQARYVRQCIQRILDEDLLTLDVRPDAQRAFNERVQKRLGGTVWATGCRSWYLDASGKNYTLWPGYTAEYWLKTRRPDPDAFETRLRC